MMGSGKSTVGRLIAAKLKWKFYDSDKVIEDEQKMTVAEIFAAKGEAAFRELETRVLSRLAREADCVIATGGGAPTVETNWKFFGEKSAVVWLKSSPETLLRRLERGGAQSRPLLKDALSKEKILEILKNRERFYQRAGFVVESDGLEPQETADKIFRLVAPK
ncbi:MAG: hypothetical protein A2901_05635 [Elusimicrobia bacterium RIFCSPLOWO2_01_FULL_54_10]|nr:MAG: hypothetical protein A2901_05635 [Elusimicrobia bacterium RIFCSPLOWO2_01_FULL_54_10]